MRVEICEKPNQLIGEIKDIAIITTTEYGLYNYLFVVISRMVLTSTLRDVIIRVFKKELSTKIANLVIAISFLTQRRPSCFVMRFQ